MSFNIFVIFFSVNVSDFEHSGSSTKTGSWFVLKYIVIRNAFRLCNKLTITEIMLVIIFNDSLVLPSQIDYQRKIRRIKKITIINGISDRGAKFITHHQFSV